MRATGGAGARASVPGGSEARDDMASRWRGQPVRLEVWYTTLTDPRSGTGVWLHHELVAPARGAPAYAHGWASVFPPDSGPAFARFGPARWHQPGVAAVPTDGDEAADPAAGNHAGDSGGPGSDGTPDGGVVYAADTARVSGRRLWGSAGDIAWDLTATSTGEPLETFPRWAWEREVLPAAQIVPAPAAAFSGTVRYGDAALTLEEVPGATARIYGHGNARRWAWLHADLGGGDLAEVVAAVPTAPGLRRLPPLPFLRLRLDGRDWPATSLLAAATLRARIDLPTWTVTGRVGGRSVHVEVTQPPDATVAVDYRDPDGSPAVCRNTERADAVVAVRDRGSAKREWHLEGTAHAEVGTRPAAGGRGSPRASG